MKPEELALSILTIAMSGVVSGVVTFRLSAKRDIRQLRRTKLEETFKAFNGYVVQLGSHWAPFASVMSGKLDYDAALDLTNRALAGEPKHLANLEMLVAIYFPSLQIYLDRLLAIREQADEILQQHKHTYQAMGPHDASKSLSLVRSASSDLDKLEQDFRIAIRGEASKLRRALSDD